MDDLKVPRYTTEIKIYIVSTILLVIMIVALVLWNSAKEAERQEQLQRLYAAYQDLDRYIGENLKIDRLVVCRKLEPPRAEGDEQIEEEERKAREEEFAEKLEDQQQKIKDFTNHLARQFSHFNEKRPSYDNPDLMTDALLFRLNRTYNEFTDMVEKLAEKCGDLSPEEVKLRRKRYDKVLARFRENLKKLEKPGE